jgi:hypothetical protein
LIGEAIMTLSLHAATVPIYLQLLGGLGRTITKARAHCAETGLSEQDLIEARLIEDMLPFAYQVKSAWVHSLGAIEALSAGSFSPDRSAVFPASLDEMLERTAAVQAALAAIEPDALNAFTGQAMAFVIGDYRREYDADQFLLSFSMPNFFFHVTTAYDLLRMKGVPVGKMDFLGKLRTR